MISIRSLLYAASAIAISTATPLLAQSDDVIQSKLASSSAQPTVLSTAQKLAYGEIFARIRAADWAGAAARLDEMGDGPLHSIARAELYLAKGSPKVELAPLMTLLAKAPEIPQAAQLARLAEVRGAAALPDLPQAQRLIWVDGQPRRSRARSVKGDAVAAELEKQVQPLIKDNQPAAAEALLLQQQYVLTPEALTEYRQRIGWSYYIIGDDTSARRLADLARAGVGEWTLQAEWLAGLAAWRMHDCTAAAASFATVGARSTDVEFSAAGHYWAARADMMCGRPQQVQARLRIAARMEETFYGLLSRSALGIRTPAAAAPRKGADWRGIANRPNVQAAVALAEIGERSLAEEAIRYQCKIRPQDHQALLRLAADLDLPSAQMWLAHNVPPGGHVEMAARYPAPDWKPSRGWRVDPPLVYAHTLQESGFRADVVSPAGATGLMQVRPGTAGDIARGRGERFDPKQLTNPSDNIEFGQTYLEYLRDDSGTGGLLPKVIAAFNAGPAPVAEWNAREFDGGDPLLYIESIPYWETRGYVPIVLRNYWVYEQQAGRQRSTSREALVQGLWPRFPGMSGATAVRLTPRNFASASSSSSSN